MMLAERKSIFFKERDGTIDLDVTLTSAGADQRTAGSNVAVSS